MKKQIIFLAVVLLASITMVSCKKNTAQTAVLNDMNDSINYALGYANGGGIKSYYMTSVDDEKAAIDAFIKALDKAFTSDAEPDEMYELGLNIGSSLKKQQEEGLMGEADLKMNYKLVKEGLEDGLKGSIEGWSANDAQSYIQTTMMQMQMEKASANAPQGDDEELVIEEEIIEIK